jgi:hypothetical protein
MESLIKHLYMCDDIKLLNTYKLRTIPLGEQYDSLRNFVNKKCDKKQLIPTYLTEKYGDISNQLITRGKGVDKNAVRRKVASVNTDTATDKTNEDIRELLSKLCESNRVKLLDDFMKYDISDECGKTLVDNIYTFAVDLNYLVHLYADLIFLLKEKNMNLYGQLTEKIIDTAFNPVLFGSTPDSESKSKRWRVSNIKLLSEMYCKKSTDFKMPLHVKIIDHLICKMSAGDYESLEIVCELLKKSLPQLVKDDKKYCETIAEKLEPFAYDRKIDQRYRFLVRDVIDIYNDIIGDNNDTNNE